MVEKAEQVGQDPPIESSEIRQFVERLKTQRKNLGRLGEGRARKASVELLKVAQEIDAQNEAKQIEEFWGVDDDSGGDGDGGEEKPTKQAKATEPKA